MPRLSHLQSLLKRRLSKKPRRRKKRLRRKLHKLWRLSKLLLQCRHPFLLLLSLLLMMRRSLKRKRRRRRKTLQLRSPRKSLKRRSLQRKRKKRSPRRKKRSPSLLLSPRKRRRRNPRSQSRNPRKRKNLFQESVALPTTALNQWVSKAKRSTTLNLCFRIFTLTPFPLLILPSST